jgi:hypothetical protein
MGKQDGGLQLLKGAAAAGCHQCHYRILSGGSSGLHMLHLGWGSVVVEYRRAPTSGKHGLSAVAAPSRRTPL